MDRAEREVREKDAESARKLKKDARERKKAEVAQAVALRASERERKRNEKLETAQKKASTKQAKGRKKTHDLAGVGAQNPLDDQGQGEEAEQGSDMDRWQDGVDEDGRNAAQPAKESNDGDNEDEKEDDDDKNEDDDDEEVEEDDEAEGQVEDHEDHSHRVENEEWRDDWDYDIEQYQQEGEMAPGVEEESVCDNDSDSDVSSRYKRARVNDEMIWW